MKRVTARTHGIQPHERTLGRCALGLLVGGLVVPLIVMLLGDPAVGLALLAVGLSGAIITGWLARRTLLGRFTLTGIVTIGLLWAAILLATLAAR